MNDVISATVAATTTTKKSNKSKLGQFYTTNYTHILQHFTIPQNIPIIEPFAGNGDLLQYIKDLELSSCVECYDIDPKKDFIVKRDTLMDPPSFSCKFVFTNPPYLARNKNDEKEIYDLYGCNDLYKCFIEILIRDVCEGGILILPLNFISSMRSNDIGLRQRFLELYSITHMNIFEEPVFCDTAYTVCSFQFSKKTGTSTSASPFSCMMYPHKKEISVVLDATNNYTIGGEIYNLYIPKNGYKIDRATKNTKNKECITNIVVKCIDDTSKIRLKIEDDATAYIDNTSNLSSRSYATLVIEPKLNNEKQEDLVMKFNAFLGEQRDNYHSLFLTNYRENGRKRISFQLVFQICSHLLGPRVESSKS